MSDPFIQNEQYNLIKEQVTLVKESRMQSLPPSVLRAVIDLAQSKVIYAFPEATAEQVELLQFSTLQTNEAFDEYMQQLREWVQPFPVISAEQLKELFPKQKKLRLPELSDVDFGRLTYLSWNDGRSNQKLMICQYEGQLIGIACKPSTNTKKNICAFCNQFTDVTYCVTITKAKQAKNPDYYKAIGTYICVDSKTCNEHITSQEALYTFVHTALQA
ncbi:FusB/FusC family EF-G-binding protein [Exiguobacterium sp.]|uniref:FusB/FusC family EF-G-binding protein n=1 Tax=Exiguobacterium sp. TaxID=44751 RepID=UPI00307DAE14